MDFLSLLIPIFGIIFGCLVPIVLVWLALQYSARKNDLVYQTALKLAEHGQPIPPELLRAPDELRADMRRGVVLVMLGIGLSIALHEVSAPWTFGLIPMLMGMGYLAVWKIESGKSK